MANRGDGRLFGEPVLVEFVGTTESVFTVRGKVSRKSYRFGRDGFHERQYVEAGDVEALLAADPNFRMAGVPQPGASQPSGGPEPQPLAAAIRPDRQPRREAPPPPAPQPESPAEAPGTVPDDGAVAVVQQVDVQVEEPGSPTHGGDPDEPESPSTDPADMTVAQIREEVKVMGVRALEVMLADEQRGKARMSALKAIQDALNASA